MILKNIRYLVTQNADRQVLENVDILVEGDEIAGIGRGLDARGHDVIDCSRKVVMPGLVNAHTHVSMALFRGISDNKLLENWLEEEIFPAEEEMDGEDAYYGALLGITEMLKTGTTTFNDMYGYMDRVADAVDETGIRALLARGVLDMDGNGRERIDEALEFVKEYQDHGTIEPAIAPHAVYTTSEGTLRELKDYSRIFDCPYHVHVSETERENEDCIEETGLTPVQYMDSMGLVDEDFIAAHGVWLTDEDVEILSREGGSVIHNPVANLKLGSGIADVPELVERGVNVAIGTDGAASNNNLNLFEEAKIAALLHKRNDPRRLTEQDVLDMLTVNGAKALGLEDEIGSVQIGKKADLVTVDFDELSMNPVYGKRGLISNLIYSFPGKVSDTLVDGEVVVRGGEVVNIDESGLVRKVRGRTRKFDDRSGTPI